MEAQEGGGVTFRIVLVQREAQILGDLPPQGFAVARHMGLGSHTVRYDPLAASEASCLPRG